MSRPRRVNLRGANNKKPRLGQNFLQDGSAAARIAEALGDVSASMVIEIGPGKGAITRILAERAQKLLCIELDRVLAAQMRMEYARRRNVEVLEADVLSVDFDTLVQGALRGITDREPLHRENKARVVGNLPYYITSDILLRLFAFHANFDEIVIMVQKEVADRVAAGPGSRDFGLLSATAQLYCRVEKLFTLPPEAFSPPPKVYSTVLRLTVAPRMDELGVDTEGFIAFLRLSFGQKRKTLVNNLKAEFPVDALTAALRAGTILPTVRAEALSVEQLAALYRRLRKNIG